MLDYASTGYNVVLALHIVSIIAWMAGLLYLPRLFVYHTTVRTGSEQSELFKVMERRLLKAIMTPAMVASWLFGLWLAFSAGFFVSGWFHIKLALVILLTACHLYLARAVKDFADDCNTRSQAFWRALNEGPTVLMIGIVFLVVLKPL